MPRDKKHSLANKLAVAVVHKPGLRPGGKPRNVAGPFAPRFKMPRKNRAGYY